MLTEFPGVLTEFPGRERLQRGHSCEQALRAGPDRAGMGKAGRAGPNPLPEGSGRGYKHAGPGHARPIRPGPRGLPGDTET